MTSPKKLLHFGLIIFAAAFFASGWAASASAQKDDSDPLSLGAQVYAENCAVCHGEGGEGRIGATLAKNWPSIRPELATRASIAEGVSGTAMPAWGQENGGPLTDEEISAVVAYILSWQTGGAPTGSVFPTITAHPGISPVPNVAGDPNQGAILYGYNCAVCHGAQGEGRIGATLTKNWGSIRPDLTIRSTIARGSEGSLMPAWSQENGGPLNETEIDNIVAYVLSWPSAQQPTPPQSAPSDSAWTGWVGLIGAILLFILIVAAIFLIQKPKTE